MDGIDGDFLKKGRETLMEWLRRIFITMCEWDESIGGLEHACIVPVDKIKGEKD